jgi:membrane protease YdiL (CAAX protease family)
MHVPFNLCLALSAQPISPVSPLHAPESRAMIVAYGWLFSLGLLCDLYLLYRFCYRPRKDRSQGCSILKVGPKPWGIVELVQLTALIIGLFLLSNSFYLIAAALTHRTVTQLLPLVIFTELIVRVAVLAGVFYLLRRQNRSLSDAFGLDAISPLDTAGWATVFGLASLPPVQGLVAATDKLGRLLGWKPSEQPIAELFTSADSPLFLLLLVVFAVVVAPVFEELFFRGFMYPALKQRFGAWRAMSIVSILFALSHAHLPSFLPLFILALGFGLAYELTGSLLVPTGMHALFNAMMVVKLMFDRAHP